MIKLIYRYIIQKIDRLSKNKKSIPKLSKNKIKDASHQFNKYPTQIIIKDNVILMKIVNFNMLN